MGAGVFLVIVGAILTFAIRKDSSVIDLHAVGLILMLAGAGVMFYAQRETKTEHEVTEIEDNRDPERPTHVVREVTREKDIDH